MTRASDRRRTQGASRRLSSTRREASASNATATPPLNEAKSEAGRRTISAQLALAFTARWLPAPHRLGDARLFSTGRLQLWDGLGQIPPLEQKRICRFRLICARGLEQDPAFLRECLSILHARESFEALRALGELNAGQPESGDAVLELPFRALYPSRLEEDIVRWMVHLEQTRTAGRINSAAQPTGERLTLHAWNGTYSVPASHLPAEAPVWPRVETTSTPEIKFDQEALLVLAESLDLAYVAQASERHEVPPVPYRARTLRQRLLEPMRRVPEDEVLRRIEPLEAGQIQLMISPTGTGKSVLTTVFALHQASLGVPVALAVPRVADVWETAYELERDIALLERFRPGTLSRSPKVASLSSSRERFEQLAQHLAHPPAWDPRGAWVLDRLGYHCALRAYLEPREDEPLPQRGDEPCHGAATARGPRATQRMCPFLAGCPLHTPEREALSADIIVINHHALLMGMHRLPTVLEHDPVARRRPLLETLLVRCGVIVLDEVDVLQKTVIDQDAGNLALASRGPLSPIHRLFRDLEEHAARSDKPLTPHHDRTRRQLMSIQTAAQELTHLLERDLLDWQPPPHLRFHGSSDPELCRVLLRPPSDETPLVEADYLLLHRTMTDHRNEAPSTLRPLQEAARAWIDLELDDPRTVDDRLEALGEVLKQPLHGGRAPTSAKQRERIRDLLALRAGLWRLARTLHQLSLVLPELSRLALPSAEPVQDALGASRVATLSPLGPLGEDVYGFSWQGSDGAAVPLRTLALRGDPHGDLVQLGDTLALALAGRRRVVLGLSATAWFSGSPLCHVHGRLRFLRPDPEHAVTCLLEPSEIEISGIGEPERRRKNCEALGRELWPRLEEERNYLRSRLEFEGQDKMLLVTGSYDEARHAAHGLALAMGGQPRSVREIWAVQRDRGSSPLYHTITHRDIETFGRSDAWILVAPLSVITRGHNILQAGSVTDPVLGSRSALGSIYLLVRPVPPLSDASRLLAHVTATRSTPSPEHRVSQRVTAERSAAWVRYHHFLWGAGALSRLPDDIRHEVICDVLAELAQLAGRARRGGTHVRIHLVDGAFVGRGRWTSYLKESFDAWRSSGQLPGMVAAHGAFLRALATLIDISLEDL